MVSDVLNMASGLFMIVLVIAAIHYLVSGRIKWLQRDKFDRSITISQTQQLCYASSIASACIEVATKHPNLKDIYFENSQNYCDSFLQVSRSSNSGVLQSLNIGVTPRPTDGNSNWLSYAVEICDPETNPRITFCDEWYGCGMRRAVNSNDYEAVINHIKNVCKNPVASVKPPQLAPDDLY